VRAVTPKRLKECPFHLGKRLSTATVTIHMPNPFSESVSDVVNRITNLTSARTDTQ
jgi:hypothetical protein